MGNWDEAVELLRQLNERHLVCPTCGIENEDDDEEPVIYLKLEDWTATCGNCAERWIPVVKES